MSREDIEVLYQYNSWATDRILNIVATCTPEQFLKDLGSSHGGIHGTLVHTMGAEEVWLKRWKNQEITQICTPQQFPTFDAVITRWKTIETDIDGFCRTLKTDEDILRICDYKDLKGNAYSGPLHQLMQHLVNHSTYHRGQVVTMLRQTGLKPVATYLVKFYREMKKSWISV